MKKINSIICIVLVWVLALTSASFGASPISESLMYPFTVPWDDDTKTAADVSYILDAPAGKHGFLKSQNGHFFFEDGTRMRMWGTNLAFGANFPSKENAQKMAGHLAKLGFNIVRFHHMDSDYGKNVIFDSSPNTLNLSADQLDKMDYLIWCLKQRGIYVDLNLHVGRIFRQGDNVVDYDKLPSLSKLVTLFDDKIISLEKDYALKLLTHKNPYTGTRYCDEPAVALVEITNENSIFNGWNDGRIFGAGTDGLTQYYLDELDSKWNAWLSRKYSSDEALKSAWSNGAIENDGPNMVTNGNFENGMTGWLSEIHTGASANVGVVNFDDPSANQGLCAKIQVSKAGPYDYNIQFKQLNIKVVKDRPLILKFKAKADKERKIYVSFMKETSPWSNYGLSKDFIIDTGWKEYEVAFSPNVDAQNDTRLSFTLGQTEGTVVLDDVRLYMPKRPGLLEGESLLKSNIKRIPWDLRLSFSQSRIKDETEFYTDLEITFFKEMLTYLKNNLNIKVPISTSNNFNGNPDLLAQSVGDYMDSHNYWDHITFPQNPWDHNVFAQRNNSLISENSWQTQDNGANTFLAELSQSKIADKPFVVSEWNHVFPNDYEYEMPMLLASYASFQDWDGLFQYSYSHEDYFAYGYTSNWFDMKNNTLKQVSMAQAALIFQQGLVKPYKSAVKPTYGKEDILNSYAQKGRISDYGVDRFLPGSLIMCSGFAKQSLEAERSSGITSLMDEQSLSRLNEGVLKSDTGEITWDRSQKGREYITVDTPCFKGIDGFVASREIKLQNITFSINENASVGILSKDRAEVSSPGTKLITLAARQKNTGQVKDANNGLSNWGIAPMLLEPVTGYIKWDLPLGLAMSAWALDGRGQRVKSLEVLNNTLSLTYDVKSPWIEVEILKQDTERTIKGRIAKDIEEYPKNKELDPQLRITEIFGGNIKGASVLANPDGTFELKGVSTEDTTIRVESTGYLARTFYIPKGAAGADLNNILLYSGDVNGDGAVSMSDIMEVVAIFNTSDQSIRYNRDIDLDRDGAINMSDIMIVVKNFAKI
ncbi:MAG: carbohydrate binding domain-containing protein [Clostridia bacterium]|nr:carbohydrate binding domain-containing protein [Clostridia bacterium]